MYTTTELIDSVLADLNEIECKGVDNFARIINCINKLASIKESCAKLEENKRGIAADDSQDGTGD